MRSFDDVLEMSSLGKSSEWFADLNDNVAGEAESLARLAAEGETQRYSIGIELLPGALYGVVADESGHCCGQSWIPLSKMDAETVVDSVADFARGLAADSLGLTLPDDRVVLGMQLGGPVDPDTGRVRFFSKPGVEGPIEWTEVDLARLVREATGLRSFVLNDAEALAVREQWVGVGRRSGDFAVLMVRQGVGGSLVLDGKLVKIPFEIGNLPVRLDAGGPVCDCGQRGCLEITAGTTGIVDRVRELTGVDVDGIVAAAELVEDASTDVRAKAAEVFAAAGEAIAHGIGVVVTLHGPKQVVVYALQVMADADTCAGAAFIEKVNRYDKYVSHRHLRDCEIVYRPLRPYTGAHGAALAALTELLGLGPTVNLPTGAQE